MNQNKLTGKKNWGENQNQVRGKNQGENKNRLTEKKNSGKKYKSTHGKGGLEGELLRLRWKTAFGNSEPVDFELMREPTQKVLGR